MLELLPYQKEGVNFLKSKTYALLADDPGLGKTAQVLRSINTQQPVLVICPKVAKGVWKAEATKWIGPNYKVTICKSKATAKYPAPGEMVIMSYDSADITDNYISKNTILVADEAHLVKAGNNKRCALFRTITRQIVWNQGKIWLLTGTPMPNNPQELWNILAYTPMAEEAWGNERNFFKLFNGFRIRTAFGIQVKWGKPTPAAGEGFRKVALRRRRHEVLKELPEKFYQEDLVPISREALKACTTLLKKLEEMGIDEDRIVDVIMDANKYGIPAQLIAEARKALAIAKIPTLLEHVSEAENTQTPLVVFSAHRAPIDALNGRPGWGIITGDTSANERTRLVEEFQAGNLIGMAATIKAAGVALTLTKANKCLFVDRDWTPANNSQAEARLQRIGQKFNVLVTTLVCEHAIDTKVYKTLIKKQMLIEEVVGNG
jgi:hypothetical protein